jgi:hypothetical protein
MLSFQITNLPITDSVASARRDHLWVTLSDEAGGPGNIAIYFGADDEINANDLASRPYRYVLSRLAQMGLHVAPEEIREALESYRNCAPAAKVLRRAAA